MKEFLGIAYSPLLTPTLSEGESQPLYLKELRDLARGFCGALVVALPLHYTQEMWERATLIPLWMLLGLLALTWVANVGYVMFEGYKPEPERHNARFDALTAMGLGLVGSYVTLLLIGRYGPATPPDSMARLVLLETVPASFGASLAINQLGVREGYTGRVKQVADSFPKDWRKVLATILGGVFFAFNIAPTEEPQLIAAALAPWHLLGIIGFSLFVSSLMVFFADFIERDDHQGALGPRWVETLVAYLLSLAVSALLLWFFGYLHGGVSLSLALTRVITLGYVTSLGGSAGRVIL